MNAIPHFDSRPEAMADVPGACQISLTRAVVQYRDLHEVDTPGGRIQDIGVALILEGRYASSAEAIDLGSGAVKLLDLSQELVVLDWIYEPTLEHLSGLLRGAAESGDRTELKRFAFHVGMQVLERVGWSPLTRPSLIRLGFRDLCRDLDLHEGTSIRVVMDAGRVVRMHMDYDGNALVIRTPTAARDAQLEEALGTAFPGSDIRRIVPSSSAAAGGYQLRFSLPQSLEELREQMTTLRGGVIRLLGRFEPARISQLESVIGTFGHRETLARIRGSRDELHVERISSAVTRSGTVH